MSRLFVDDQITWKKGQEYVDGSTILMIERLEDRAVDVAAYEARCLLCCIPFYPKVCGVVCVLLLVLRREYGGDIFFYFFVCFFLF